MRDVAGVLKARASFVLYDAPPILAATDALLLGSLLDGVVLSLRSGVTRRDDALRAREALERVHARILGTVLTNARESWRIATTGALECGFHERVDHQWGERDETLPTHLHARQAADPSCQQTGALSRHRSASRCGDRGDRRRRRAHGAGNPGRFGRWPVLGRSLHFHPSEAAGGARQTVQISQDFLLDDPFVMFLGDNVLQGGLRSWFPTFDKMTPAHSWC